MGGGFNDRADVQRTCRGMLGDGLKKHSSSLWPGKAAQGQLCGGAVGGGGGVASVSEPDTCLQQKAGDQGKTLYTGNPRVNIKMCFPMFLSKSFSSFSIPLFNVVPHGADLFSN